MTLEEYYGAGEYENYRPTAAQLCPVIYGLSEEDDVGLLEFNCGRCDIVLHERRISELGSPASVPPEGWEAWAAAFKAKNSVFEGSVVFGFLAMAETERFKANGMHATLEWLLEVRGAPFAVFRDRASCPRWYEEPGLGWEFEDDNEFRFRYCHPSETPRKGDYALQKEREGRFVRRQTSTYRGRNRRYKVQPV
jgi:hypothetical protein